MKFLMAIIFLVSLISGCAGVAPVVTQTKIIDRPALNVAHKEELGNTLLEYFVSNTQPSIRVNEQWGISSKGKYFPPQILRPVGVGEKISRYYVEDMMPGIPDSFRNVCYDRSDKVFFMPNGFGACDAIGKSILNSGPLMIEYADYVDVRTSQFKQELIYNGKVGSNVKFLYREITGGYMRAPFSQEIQYDLAEGNLIGFKGARIEIIESSNRYIEYKVLKTFTR